MNLLSQAFRDFLPFMFPRLHLCQKFHPTREKQASLLQCHEVQVPSETVHEDLHFVVLYNAILYFLSKHLQKNPYAPKYTLPNIHFQKRTVLYICFCKVKKYILFAKCHPFKVLQLYLEAKQM